MDFEQALKELQTEAVTEGTMEKAIAKTFASKSRPLFTSRRLIFAVGIASIAGFALYPWRKTDQLWAQAKQALVDAKYVHIRLEKDSTQGPTEVWIHGEKVIETTPFGDTRYNGKMITVRIGQVSSTRLADRSHGYLSNGYRAFSSAVNQIKGGYATKGSKVWNGKTCSTYRFVIGGIRFSNGPDSTTSDVVADAFLTAYVDSESNRIVHLEQHAEANKNLETYKKTHKFTLGDSWLENHRMEASIDYPESIDESRFDPPVDAFDQEKSKEVVASLLAGDIGTQTVGGQKVTLHGILFDGRAINVIWSGCPADFLSNDRFSLEGVSVFNMQDVRCLSSGKCMQPFSSKVPFCQQGAGVSGAVPATVNLKLPVFAPDKSRPYGKKGFYSKKVGEVTFKAVPVTRTLRLHWYERQFGLLNHWW